MPILDTFVNVIRHREGSKLWVSNEDGLAQAKMIDMDSHKLGPFLKYSCACYL
jgi:hypothetical protein